MDAGYAMQSQMASGGFKQSGGIRTFSKFYGQAVGDTVVGNYLTEAILPSLLHEDPRFFRLGRGSFWQRASHAVTSIAVVHRDAGGSEFNFSEVIGNMAVVGATTVYHPESRTAGEASERYALQIGNDVISNLLAEFWPDIRHRMALLRHVR
jgi:hypothetical protein